MSSTSEAALKDLTIASDSKPCTSTPLPGMKPKKKKKAKIYADVSACRYPIIRKALSARGFNLFKKYDRETEAKSDILWSDSNEILKKPLRLNGFQKINHFPYMQDITRKDFLANNLKVIGKLVPEEYNFHPATYLIPGEYHELKAQMESTQHTYIVKPKTLCQGKGIRLIKSISSLAESESCVVQRYVSKPLLIDTYKFDLRIYVVVLSVAPLKIYTFRNGLARFCTTPFKPPTLKNLKQSRMHLTNFSINRKSRDFVKTKDEENGSKRSLAFILKWIRSQGHDDKKVWTDIVEVMVKTIFSIYPKLRDGYQAYFPSKDDTHGSSCFEILGFDIMLDEKLKPWLIEVNDAPSFSGSSKLDKEIKGQLIEQVLDLLDVTGVKKRKFLVKKKREWKKRLWSTQPVGAALSTGSRETILPSISPAPSTENNRLLSGSPALSEASSVEATEENRSSEFSISNNHEDPAVEDNEPSDEVDSSEMNILELSYPSTNADQMNRYAKILAATSSIKKPI